MNDHGTASRKLRPLLEIARCSMLKGETYWTWAPWMFWFDSWIYNDIHLRKRWFFSWEFHAKDNMLRLRGLCSLFFSVPLSCLRFLCPITSARIWPLRLSRVGPGQINQMTQIPPGGVGFSLQSSHESWAMKVVIAKSVANRCKWMVFWGVPHGQP